MLATASAEKRLSACSAKTSGKAKEIFASNFLSRSFANERSNFLTQTFELSNMFRILFCSLPQGVDGGGMYNFDKRCNNSELCEFFLGTRNPKTRVEPSLMCKRVLAIFYEPRHSKVKTTKKSLPCNLVISTNLNNF